MASTKDFNLSQGIPMFYSKRIAQVLHELDSSVPCNVCPRSSECRTCSAQKDILRNEISLLTKHSARDMSRFDAGQQVSMGRFLHSHDALSEVMDFYTKELTALEVEFGIAVISAIPGQSEKLWEIGLASRKLQRDLDMEVQIGMADWDFTKNIATGMVKTTNTTIYGSECGSTMTETT